MLVKSPNATDKHVGARVRMRRLMLGMSQTKLGEAVGLTFQQIHKYEKGTNRIGGSRLQQFAHILHVPVPFFFEGLPQVSESSDEGAAPSPLTSMTFSRPPKGYRSRDHSWRSIIQSSAAASSIWSNNLPPATTDAPAPRPVTRNLLVDSEMLFSRGDLLQRAIDRKCHGIRTITNSLKGCLNSLA
jgi:transcriptional regulator with XRE-family HTH domain